MLPAGLTLDPGLPLALRLLRPFLLLCAVALYRCCYCLATLHRQLRHKALPPALQEARRYADLVCRPYVWGGRVNWVVLETGDCQHATPIAVGLDAVHL